MSRTGSAASPRRRRLRPPSTAQTVPLEKATTDLLSSVKTVSMQAQHLREQAATFTSTQRALHDTNRPFAELYDFVPVPYLLLSVSGVIMRANERALQMFGVEPEWMVGRPLVAYLETSCVRKVLERILACRPGQSTSVEATLRTGNGPVPAHLTMRREAAKQEHDAMYHVALVDLGDMRRLQEERRLADQERQRSLEGERTARAASEAKDEFLAMLSHELRTPLTPILAAADTLISHAALSEETREAIDIIRRNVKAEAHLIEDLLDVARISRKAFMVDHRPVDLDSLLSDLARGWKTPLAERDIALHVEPGAAASWVRGDAARLAQVFRNLLDNAAKFTGHGGTVTVRSESQQDGLRVTFTDTGIGIAPNTFCQLFSPFVRTHEAVTRGGLGLGLVICKGIVEAHGGSLHITSAGAGQGTTVIVDLPTMAIPVNEARGETQQDVEAGQAASRRRVLLVEDDRDSAQMLVFLLTSEGFVVEVAHSLYQATRLADCCDLIVSDISLPDGSGLELIRALHSARPHRAIALSGYGSSDDVARSLAAGFSEHLTKPVDLDRLVEAVRRLAASE